MRIVPLAVLASLSLSIAVVACGSDSNSSTDGNPGGGSGGSGGSGSGSGGNGTLTLSGIAKEITTNGSSPLPGVLMTAYKASDDSVLGMATTGSDGTFSITVTATTVDGYLKATYGTYKTTYLYPPHPLTMDYANVPVYVVSANNYSLVNTFVLMNGQTNTNGWVAMLLQDGSGAPVAGATVTSSPMGTVNYNGSNGQPSKAATATFTDGIAYDTNIATGTVTVSAMATGQTFMSHAIKVRADALTLTLVTP